MKTTWRTCLEPVLARTGETIEQLIFNPSSINLDRKFDDGYGSENGVPFVAHGKTHIYFCACYDGAEWVESLPRHPEVPHEPAHIGG